MKRKALFIIVGLLLFVATLAFNVSKSQSYNRKNSQTTGEQANQNKSVPAKNVKNGKTLIVYFSRSGTNYPDVNIKIGHTKRLSMFIADYTHGDQYEIVPTRAYPKNYQATVDQAEREQQQNARPAIKNPLPDVSQYDTIFIGYPIWFNEQPMIVRTFMDEVNLNHKNVVPFSTNAGSGWGDSISILKKTYQNARVLTGFSIEGSDADSARNQVNRWLQKIGY